MAYIKISNKQIMTVADIMNENPMVTFPNMGWDDEMLNPFGYAVLNRPATHPFPKNDEILVDGEPYKNETDGLWYLPWIIRKLTEEEITDKLFRMRETMIVSPFQAKAALFQSGLLDNVEDFINSQSTSPLVKIAWNNAIEFRRNSPIIAELGSALGLTDTQIDTLFREASNIQI